MQRLEEYVRQAKRLPAGPRILPQLIELLKKEDANSGNVVHLITFDPALTARVLQVCNSATYAGSQPAADVHQAVARLGFGEVYKIVARVISEQALAPAQKGYGIGKGELWEHCGVTAVAAQAIAEDLGLDAQSAFTTGLLHDIGKLILSTVLESTYHQLIEETERKQCSLLEAERTVLGADHAQVGGRILAEWKFPAALINAVTHHHDPAAAPAEDRKLAACVYMANMVAAITGHSYGYQALALQGRGEALDILGITGDRLPIYMIKTIDAARKASLIRAA